MSVIHILDCYRFLFLFFMLIAFIFFYSHKVQTKFQEVMIKKLNRLVYIKLFKNTLLFLEIGYIDVKFHLLVRI